MNRIQVFDVKIHNYCFFFFCIRAISQKIHNYQDWVNENKNVCLKICAYWCVSYAYAVRKIRKKLVKITKKSFLFRLVYCQNIGIDVLNHMLSSEWHNFQHFLLNYKGTLNILTHMQLKCVHCSFYRHLTILT